MRLKRWDPPRGGIRRHRHGRGFRYFSADGRPVDDPDELTRISGLAVPPAWRDVWICPYPNGHLQAVGTDDAGRRQYLYHEEWRRRRDDEKHNRVLRLARRLPGFRAAVEADLVTRGFARRRVLAGALRMLDRGVFRTGGEEYAEEHGTRGAATLLRDDVAVRGEDLVFRYPAKGGIERCLRLRDDQLRKLVVGLRRHRTASERLLVFRAGDGWQEIRAEDINERFKELAGEEFTAKDLRTWNATVFAAVAFAEAERPTSQRGRKRVAKAVMEEVAEQLGNTPAVARKSYVDPRVLGAFEDGVTVRTALRRAGSPSGDELPTTVERAVLRMLTRRKK